MSTRAIEFLKKKDLTFEVVKYDHKEKGAAFASESIDFPLERTIKTVVVDLGNSKYTLVLMPGDKNLDLKRLAKLLSSKKAAMADSTTAERLTGYLVGGISPFGVKKKLPVVMEQTLLDYKSVVINAGQRGILVKMAPKDISKAVNSRCLDIVNRE